MYDLKLQFSIFVKPELELAVQGVSINVSCTHLMETKQGQYDAAAAADL